MIHEIFYNCKSRNGDINGYSIFAIETDVYFAVQAHSVSRSYNWKQGNIWKQPPFSRLCQETAVHGTYDSHHATISRVART